VNTIWNGAGKIITDDKLTWCADKFISQKAGWTKKNRKRL
jgi:hypothetical protein